MKKKTVSLLTLALTLLLSTAFSSHVYAADFEGKEDTYIKLCSSSSLSSKQQATCKEFNTYLSKKNKTLKEEAAQAKKDASKTESTLDDIKEQLAEYENKIAKAQSELSYINKTITSYNKQIEEKNKLLQDRLYTMQTSVNSQSYVNFLFGAEDLTDLIRRISSLNEIAKYDNELISELNSSLQEVEKQKSTLQTLKTNLEADQTAQKSLQKKYTALLNEQKETVSSNTKEVAANEESMDVINANLAAIQKAASESKVSNVTQAIPSKKNNTSQSSSSSSSSSSNSSSSSSSNSSSNNNSNSNSSSSSNNNQASSSSEKLGIAIANKALTRQGCPYVWGAAHSWSQIQNPSQSQFDCSGLVNWAHYQAGVNLGTIHYTKSLLSAGQAVSRSNLQAGDIILFSSNGSSSGVHHVGIYIGGNKMVHAPVPGMNVQVADLSLAYWQNEWYTCRRLY